ncbi:MAG: hypothetical protein WC627_09535 [Legionella sp.]
MMQRVLLVLLTSCSFYSFAADTVLKLYRPFGEAVEQVSPMVVKTIAGQCISQSTLILREDAWRCQAEGKMYDPCFVKTIGANTDVICPQSPWVGDSVRIQVANQINNDHNTSLDMSTAYPWAIELSTGEKCQAIESSQFVEGMPVRYRCSNSNYLFGHLQRCESQWSMLEKTHNGVETVALSKVWF